MPEFVRRNRPAHPPLIERHNQPTILFVTVCVAGRLNCLANDAVHQSLVTAWKAADAWTVGRYLVMPDHIHLFCTPGVFPPMNIKRWTSYWKRLVTQSLGAHPWRWQADCWDLQMRNQRHYLEKLEYARQNPVRAGLVACEVDWKFQGELNVISW